MYGIDKSLMGGGRQILIICLLTVIASKHCIYKSFTNACRWQYSGAWRYRSASCTQSGLLR